MGCGGVVLPDSLPAACDDGGALVFPDVGAAELDVEVGVLPLAAAAVLEDVVSADFASPPPFSVVDDVGGPEPFETDDW